MDKNKELIFTIKKLINGLKHDKIVYDYHSWNDNLGCLIKELLNLSQDELEMYLEHTWMPLRTLRSNGCHNNIALSFENVIKHSMLINKQLPELVVELINKGLTQEILIELETLTNETILKLSGIDTSDEWYFTEKENYIAYLEAWYKNAEDFEKQKQISELEAELNIAIDSKNNEQASKIREQLNELYEFETNNETKTES